MYCIASFSQDGVAPVKKIPVKEAKQMERALRNSEYLIDLNASFAYVRDSIIDIDAFFQENKNKQIGNYLYGVERVVRIFLIEFRVYIEHMKASITDQQIKGAFDMKVQKLKKNDGPFAFTWELRNYVTHTTSIVEIIDDNMHPCVRKSTLLNWKRGNIPIWQWSSGPYLQNLPDVIDLMPCLKNGYASLRQIHLWLINQIKLGHENDIHRWADLGRQIMKNLKIAEDQLWEYYFGQMIYNDDNSDVPEEEFFHPTNNRQKGYQLSVMRWDSIFELDKIV